jgi:hypothetical protein
VYAPCCGGYNKDMWRGVGALLLFGALFTTTSGADYVSAQQKFALIEADKAPRGSSVFLSAEELNAWVKEEAASAVPGGLRNPKVELGEGTAKGYVLVDFLKLRQAKGLKANWFLTTLLSGEKPVQVTARIISGAGRATVDVERVEVSGVTVSGSALDFLIENFLLPLYPDVKIGQPFELSHNIERLDIRPEGVAVVIKN